MSSQRFVRLNAEMKMIASNPVPGFHCWRKHDSQDTVYVEMEGPNGSPYEKGIFKLEVVLSDRYPFTPPIVKFVTPIYHPNIDPNGRICLSALKPKPTGTWAVTLNIATVLGAIRILLSEPNLSDPLMTDIAKEYTENYKAYHKHAADETSRHAIRKKIGTSDGVVQSNLSKKRDSDGNAEEEKTNAALKKPRTE